MQVSPTLYRDVARRLHARHFGGGAVPQDIAELLVSRYRFDPAGYVRDYFGWEPWRGSEDAPGQKELYDSYTLSLRKQHEKRDLENRVITEAELRYYTPGETIKSRFRIEAGHTVGKTFGFAGLVNHFFDCFPPSITYSFAPTQRQIKDLLWKDIRSNRDKAPELPGRTLSLRLDRGPDHFATGIPLNNQGGMGTERAQGQHGEYLMFVLDEAEGLPDFIYDAVDSMTSGGIAVVLMAANPKTRASKFYKIRTNNRVQNFRISCHSHPNVVSGREVVPNAVRRDYIEQMLETGMKERGLSVVAEHNPDRHTFSLPFSVTIDGRTFEPGTIFEPDREYLWRVMGIAPGDAADNTLIPVGRYEAALARKAQDVDPAIREPHKARLGIDVARFGRDMGTGYVRWNGVVRRFAQFPQKTNLVYKATIKTELLRLAALGVTDVEVRVDGGGGFGGGVIDLLRADLDLRRALHRFVVYEVLFNGTPKDPLKYADPITEMTDKAGEALKHLRLENVPDVLLEDLTERTYDYALYKGVLEVKQLQSKKEFKRAHENRSPDDGDGFTLCAAPDYLMVQPKRSGNESRVTSHSD